METVVRLALRGGAARDSAGIDRQLTPVLARHGLAEVRACLRGTGGDGDRQRLYRMADPAGCLRNTCSMWQRWHCA